MVVWKYFAGVTSARNALKLSHESHVRQINFVWNGVAHGYLGPPAGPGPPTPVDPGGTYARSPSPDPPYLGTRLYPLSRVLVTIGSYIKTPPFPCFLGKSSQDYSQTIPPPPFRRKLECTCSPLMHSRVGGGGTGLRVQFKILLTMYKCVTGFAPDYRCELFSSYTPARRLVDKV